MTFFAVYIAIAAGLLFVALIVLIVTMIVLAVKGRSTRLDRQLYRSGSESRSTPSASRR
ncbi:hypothetical protein [Frondihabitans cladoniiphilus]|uniref:Uncharacterized protein n=1 Tax=Frondihabitans cladoniiphilus TaxID=715785 RepID=A0ABP8W4M3_9MICO